MYIAFRLIFRRIDRHMQFQIVSNLGLMFGTIDQQSKYNITKWNPSDYDGHAMLIGIGSTNGIANKVFNTFTFH